MGNSVKCWEQTGVDAWNIQLDFVVDLDKKDPLQICEFCMDAVITSTVQ